MTIRKPNPEEEAKLASWRHSAMQLMPYMGATLYTLRAVATDEVDTFAVDQQMRLYVNFENLTAKTPRFAAEGLLHECCHVLAGHSELAETAGVTTNEHDVWNIAGDCAINDDLRDAGCIELAEHGILPGKLKKVDGQPFPDYRPATEYLGYLRERIAKSNQQKKQQGQQGKDSSAGGQQPYQGGQQSPGGGAGTKPEPHKGCGSGAGGRRGSFEMDPSDDLGGAAPAASEDEITIARIQTQAAMEQYAKSGRGTVPRGMQSMVNEALRPSKTPWQKVLGPMIRHTVRRRIGQQETTFERRNRRRMGERMMTANGRGAKIIVPSYTDPMPSIALYRDVSASHSSRAIAASIAETAKIAKTLNISGSDLTITDVDARVYETVRYSGTDDLRTLHGRGGTNMGKAIEHAEQLRKKPTAIVIATDGETPWPERRPSVPVIILLAGTTREAVQNIWPIPSWAKVVEVEL